MEMVELKASSRSQVGKKGAKQCRRSGLVPGILYGRSQQAAPVAVDPKDLSRAMHTHAGSNVIIKLLLDNKAEDAATVVVKDLQVDTLKGTMTHVDFCHISLDEVIRTSVPFKIVGDAPGVKQGGILEHTLWELDIETLPLNIPDAIEINVSQLEMGDSLTVADLMIPEGIEVLTDPEIAVVSIVAPRVEPTVEAVAAPVEGEEPEVITAKAEKETEEEPEKSSEKRKEQR